VNKLLDLSRITSGKVELDTTRLDLAELLRITCEDQRGLLESGGLKLNVETPSAPIWIDGDVIRLAQVLGNILQNAAKFTGPGGGVSVRVRIQPSVDPPAWMNTDSEGATPGASPAPMVARVEVEDTGIGIDPEALPDLFEPFTQGDRTLDRSTGGLGLGLAVVKGIINLHGGTVRAESRGRGRGALFSFEIPLQSAPEDLSLSAAQGHSLEGSPPHAGSTPLRIQVIEDNRDLAATLRDLLELFGHVVQVAHSGVEGVEAAVQNPPDVVLCDLGLPGMDGFQVAAALKEDPRTASARLIAVSGYGEESARQQALDSGFEIHLTKPVDAARLKDVLIGDRPINNPDNRAR
jgi:CheY-like chemotaxis protein